MYCYYGILTVCTLYLVPSCFDSITVWSLIHGLRTLVIITAVLVPFVYVLLKVPLGTGTLKMMLPKIFWLLGIYPSTVP
jgi:hypothetical protein